MVLRSATLPMVSIDVSIGISTDTPLATSIDYSIGVSIDTALSKLYARVDTMLTMILDQLSHISRGP